MTDVRVFGVVREVVTSGTAQVNLKGEVREVVTSGTGQLKVQGLVREVVRSSTTASTGVNVYGLAREVVLHRFWSVSLTEAGSATDSISVSFAGVASLTEAASAGDAISSSFAGVASLTEAASADDTLSATLSWSVSLTEAGSADDAISSSFAGVASLTEAGSADDAISAIYSAAGGADLTEPATADDVISATFTGPIWSVSLTEAGSATDTISASFDQTGLIKESGGALIDTSESAVLKEAGAVAVETGRNAVLKQAGAVEVVTFLTAVLKLAGAAIIEGIPPPELPRLPGPPRRRIRLGMAEYTHTEGLADYVLRGALPDFFTLRSQLIDREVFRYRARSGHIEEVGEGRFHYDPNTVTRIRALFGSALVSWGPGRRLLYVTDDYSTPPVGELSYGASALVTGIGEYTHTEGLDPYQLLGPIREWQTFAQAVRDGQRVLYRATNNAQEELAEGTFDAVNNQLKRGPVGVGSTLVNWGSGRKLLYVIERY